MSTRWPIGPRRPGAAVAASAVAAALAVILPSCTAGRGARDHAAPQAGAIRLASFDFPESELLARIYAGALRGEGYAVEVETEAGSREIVEPALARGLVDFVPEYAGSSLEFLSLGRAHPSSDLDRTYRSVAAAFARHGIVALEPSPAQDANGIVVTRATAAAYNLHTISDLAPVASRLTFGGPPECPERRFCLAGLRERYGLRFRQFVSLDTGGPLTVQALRGQDIDVGLLFTTDPVLTGQGLVALADDRHLQPAENVMPVVRAAVLKRYGDALARTVDAVSARLTTDGLRELEALVLGGRPASVVATGWLADQGLA